MRSGGGLAALVVGLGLLQAMGAAAGGAQRGAGHPPAVAKAEYLSDKAPSSSDEDTETDEEESDSAPFMVVVEHQGSAWKCVGALVSTHAVLTSGWCARGLDGPGKLWVVATATATGQASRQHGARRVASVMTAAGPDAWDGAIHDIALLELEAPFDSAVAARPILMAAETEDCPLSATCHVVQSLPTRSGKLRLRIADAWLARGSLCAPMVRYWEQTRGNALCVQGPELCARDWGAGVVCGGKLCGLISRSLSPTIPPAGDGGARSASELCSEIHMAQSVPHWRRFINCAHTLHSCGRDQCAEVCTERRFLDPLLNDTERRPVVRAKVPVTALPEHRAPGTPEPHDPGDPVVVRPTRLLPASPTTPPLHEAPPPLTRSQQSLGAGYRFFEPYRADFKLGEYGDNALDYGVADDDFMNGTVKISRTTPHSRRLMTTSLTRTTDVATTYKVTTTPTRTTPPTAPKVLLPLYTRSKRPIVLITTTRPRTMTLTIPQQSHHSHDEEPVKRSSCFSIHVTCPFIYFVMSIPILL